MITSTTVAAQTLTLATSHVLNEIEPDFDMEILMTKARCAGLRAKDIFRHLVREAQQVARPKAAVTACLVKRLSETETKLDQVVFSSELLADNLDGLGCAFAYVATEGEELARWSDSLAGSGRAFAWPIRYAALKLAEKALVRFLKSAFALGELSCMNPGPLDHWPVKEQMPLFRLLGGLPEAIGIKIKPTCWMSPDLSSSGVFFEAETKFYNCQLCTLEPCEHRRTAYQGLEGWPKPRRMRQAS